MIKKSLAVLLTLMLILGFSPAAFAQPRESDFPPGPRPSLTALGDSITTGYGLENNLLRVSRKAYPQLIGDETGYRVNNLAVSGWSSGDLLDALRDNPRYRNAVIHANLITLNIGGNDVLGYLMELDFSDPELNPITLLQEIEVRLANYYVNLGFILHELRQLNPEAPILLYGFYNPLYEGHPVAEMLGEEGYEELYDLLNFIIPLVNYAALNGTLLSDQDGNPLPHPVTGFSPYAQFFEGLYGVDAFLAFEAYGLAADKSDLFVDEVHPSEKGQQLLTDAALVVISEDFFPAAASGF